MAISVPAASSSVVSEATTRRFINVRNHHHNPQRLSFSLAPKPKLRLFSKTLTSRTLSVKAQVNKVGVDGSTNSAATSEAKTGPCGQETKNDEPSMQSSPRTLDSEESISQFMSQVASLVKLVDSRDIVELKLKQLDCEILIKKKEAITQPPPVVMMQPPTQAAVAPPPTTAPPPTAIPALPAPKPAAPPAKSANSSLPPFKCPMAGTFYRSPAPGEPPFVKVGDKVQKGQVVCIIEAMKLMNEIECDQSGTVVEIVAQDGKPVSIDTPLFVIQP